MAVQKKTGSSSKSGQTTKTSVAKSSAKPVSKAKISTASVNKTSNLKSSKVVKPSVGSAKSNTKSKKDECCETGVCDCSKGGCMICDKLLKKPILSVIIIIIFILALVGLNMSSKSSISTNETYTAGLADNDCTKAIVAYHDNANKKLSGKVIASGDSVTVDYIGRFTDDEVFDTSVESVAKACGKYTEGRDYNSGFEFVVGNGQVVPGFDKAPIGMKIGQTKTVKLTPAEGYGERSEANYQTYPIAQLPPKQDGSAYVKGDKLMSYMGEITVVDVNESGAVLDLNPPLAGKELIFDITIKNVK